MAEISKPTAGIIRSMLDLSGSRLATRAGTASATFTLFDHLGSHGAGGQHPHEGTPTHGSEHWRFGNDHAQLFPSTVRGGIS